MVLSYLCTSGPTDPKHQSLSHAVISYFAMIALDMIFLIQLSPESAYYPTTNQLLLSLILLTYTGILFSTRFVYDSNFYLEQITIYEMFWQCNVSLVLAAIGSLLGKREIVGAAVASIALDQSMWWVDLTTYLVAGKFSIGVAKYLTWKETTWTKALTSTHHLWFIPLCIYLNNGLPWESFPISVGLVALMAILTRMIVPFEIPYQGKLRYMNINCTYECWKDVKIPVLHLADRKVYIDKHFFYGFLLLNTAWNVGNFACFVVIKYLFAN